MGDIVVPPPQGRVLGVGTVIEAGGDAQLCLGIVMESYPPQCAGVPVDGWGWAGLDGSESSGDTTWGAYAVYGTYDGQRITVTDAPIMLALFDPAPLDDPTGGVDGTSDDAELTRIQDEMLDGWGDRILTSSVERGYVRVLTVWDDGTLQDAVDGAYGERVVIIDSALREID